MSQYNKNSNLEKIKDNNYAAGKTISETAEKYVCGRYGGNPCSYETYKEISENSDERYEYIDGEIYLLASPKPAHQHVQKNIFSSFINWFEKKECQPYVAPFDITLSRSGKDFNVVQPDIMIICNLKENLDSEGNYTGIPSLVVEILSPNSIKKDLIKKLDLYMSTGIKEYWIVNPMNRQITIYQFDSKNIVQTYTYSNNDIAISFEYTGLEVPLENLFL
jgi:Uma2 family endonuclease